MKSLMFASLLSVGLVFVSGPTTAPTGPFLTNKKHLELNNFPNPPVEIETIKFDGKVITSADEFTATADWPKKLEVTVRSASDEPISYLKIMVTETVDDVDVFDSVLEYRAEEGGGPVWFKQTATLKDATTGGDPTSSRPAKICVYAVHWLNDDTRIWVGGKILLKQPDGRYFQAPKPQARYQFPKGFNPNPKTIPTTAKLPEPVAMPSPIFTYCDTTAHLTTVTCRVLCHGPPSDMVVISGIAAL